MPSTTVWRLIGAATLLVGLNLQLDSLLRGWEADEPAYTLLTPDEMRIGLGQEGCPAVTYKAQDFCEYTQDCSNKTAPAECCVYSSSLTCPKMAGTQSGGTTKGNGTFQTGLACPQMQTQSADCTCVNKICTQGAFVQNACTSNDTYSTFTSC